MICSSDYLWLDNRRPDHLVDPLRTRRQHHEPVKAERNSACRRHLPERREEVFIHGIVFAVDTLLFRHRGLEARALLRDVGQFAKAVGEFNPAGVELKPLRGLITARLGPRKGGQRERILVQYSRTTLAEMPVHAFGEDTAE